LAVAKLSASVLFPPFFTGEDDDKDGGDNNASTGAVEFRSPM